MKILIILGVIALILTACSQGETIDSTPTSDVVVDVNEDPGLNEVSDPTEISGDEILDELADY